jgi:hypothetical protein
MLWPDAEYLPAAALTKKRLMRTCIFCDNPASTREHAWPQWLVRCVSQGRSSRAEYTVDGKTRHWSGPRTDLKIKHVCRGCNTGWMSTLEGQAKRIIGPMAADLSYWLSAEDQQLIARWSVKTAMVLEFISTNRFYSSPERAAFRQSLEPPPRTLVWIGRYAHGGALDCEGRNLFGTNLEGHVTTVAADRLIIQVLTVRRTAGMMPPGFVLHTKGSWYGDEPFLVQVCPPKEMRIQWPPARSIAEASRSLQKLAERFTIGEGTGRLGLLSDLSPPAL